VRDILWRIDPLLSGASVICDRCNSVTATMEKGYFLCEPSRDVIIKTVGAMSVQLSSVQEIVKIEPERVKLKNLHC
jgi:hypothetical protein